jgi:hypothetical protein
MILVVSTFITHKRPVNRFNRLDVFKHTLKSYSKIKWSRVYLFVKLDWEFRSRKEEMKNFIKQIFADVMIEIVWDRYEKQKDWEKPISNITREDDLIWFTQNDDHPFIDIDTDLLEEGILLLKKDESRFKSLYLSHWTEVLRLSGKNRLPERIENYVRFKATLLDSIQIFNSNFLKYIFLELDWNGKNYNRIDTILRQNSLWGNKNGNMENELQVIYIPLRELCRKFEGYRHVNMIDVPKLEFSYEIQKPFRKKEDIIKTINASHNSMWTDNNDFSIPAEWIDHSISLYKI